MADENVRSKLEAVANDSDISTQGVRLGALSVELGCSIHALPDYDPASEENFNCFEYALRLTEQVRNALLATLADLDVLVDYRFVRRLGDAGLLHQKTLGEMQDGDLVLYCVDGKATHAGRWEGGRVRSKWGSGLIYEHDAREVPYSYGEPRWYQAIPPGHREGTAYELRGGQGCFRGDTRGCLTSACSRRHRAPRLIPRVWRLGRMDRC